MTPEELYRLAETVVDIQRAEQLRTGGAHAGGASIFRDANRLVSWARYTAASLGDPAVGPEDLIQEVITLAYEGDSTALGGNPTWVYSLVSKQQDFLCLEEDVASREIPMSDLLADIHMILTKDEQAAMELSLEQDLSRTQIAELLLTSDREVRRLLRSARMKIKAYLHGYRHV